MYKIQNIWLNTTLMLLFLLLSNMTITMDDDQGKIIIMDDEECPTIGLLHTFFSVRPRFTSDLSGYSRSREGILKLNTKSLIFHTLNGKTFSIDIKEFESTQSVNKRIRDVLNENKMPVKAGDSIKLIHNGKEVVSGMLSNVYGTGIWQNPEVYVSIVPAPE